MRILLLSLLIIGGNFIAGAQQTSALADFSLAKFNKQVLVSWTTKADFRCEDTQLEHSTDGMNFSVIYVYPGICGANDREESYSFTHRTPALNSVNYYRLNLGAFGFSQILEITFMNFGSAGYIVYPMPFSESASIFFDNSDTDPLEVGIYNMEGKLLVEKQNIRGEEFFIDGNLFVQGTYFFVCTSAKGKKFTGKFLVN